MTNSLCPTPHNEALHNDFAKTVLMPGDPLRAKYIAENYLENCRCVNTVRAAYGYTGKYKGVSVSVMASGMGMPSIGIYSYELFNFYGVENIIRVGSAGGMTNDVNLRDIVLGQGACTDSNYAHVFKLPGVFAPIASFKLLKKAQEIAQECGLNYKIGNLLSSDLFYKDEDGLPDYETDLHLWQKMGVLAVEMEAAALYMNAARSGKNALAICTVSDHLITKEATSSKERQESFHEMMELALNTAAALG